MFGYDTGVISGAMIKLRNEFGLTYFWQELVVSVTLGTAAVFALVGGCLNDRLGRRAVILASCVIFTVGAICMGVAVDKYMLLAGRVVVGAAIGRQNLAKKNHHMYEGLDGGVWYSLFIKILAHYSSH